MFLLCVRVRTNAQKTRALLELARPYFFRILRGYEREPPSSAAPRVDDTNCIAAYASSTPLTMTLITAELLDALLSSGPSRKEAEAHFHTLDLTNRIQGLVSTLSGTANQSHILIASVLLRRDIATLGGQALEQKINPSVARDLLVNLVAPLLNLFQSLPSAPCRRQVGYCLTEVICSLSLLSEQDGQTTLESILNTIGPLVCKCLKM